MSFGSRGGCGGYILRAQRELGKVTTTILVYFVVLLVKSQKSKVKGQKTLIAAVDESTYSLGGTDIVGSVSSNYLTASNEKHARVTDSKMNYPIYNIIPCTVHNNFPVLEFPSKSDSGVIT
ncbi:hypothetical protein V493_02043 [Pseudogymnoascus sp. VKM F-4281 (FW-2241)]|nr:hypothetical protein V493_02043 [Pseudogymnoascus sp. VKM F-4281 (FW-2241)]